MNDKPRILVGLAVFLALVTFPIWYTLVFAGQASPPDLEPPAGAPLLFSVDWSEVSDGSGGDVDGKRLREEFKKHGIPLPDDALLIKGEQGGQWRKWRIRDPEKRYLVVKDQEKLRVYAGECVEEDMVANHMSLLKDWRESVVRQADKSKIEINGVPYPKSLTKCCMKCHTHRESFCTRCHEYTNVLPTPSLLESTPSARSIYCWNCHLEPKEN